MLAFKLEGRMGNQMFQFAFAKVISHKRGTNFFVDSVSTFQLNYFEFYTFTFRVCNLLNKVLYTISPKNKITLTQTGSENPAQITQKAFLSDYFDGYFQSELYFKELGAEVRRLFQIKKKYKAEFEHKYSVFLNTRKTAVIHLRRTDYLTWNRGLEMGGDNFALPFSYYDRVISLFEKDSYNIVFISDDIKEVQTYFGNKENYYFEQNNQIVDFQLMLHADVLCLSNSSFSWWGAYLNNKSNKTVYAPKYWLGFKTGIEYPANIICNDWIQIEVNNSKPIAE